MNSDNQNQAQLECCVDYCSKTYEVQGKQTVNLYKCSDKKLSGADVWNIQKNKRSFSVRKAL
jgi:hypothetical protein